VLPITEGEQESVERYPSSDTLVSSRTTRVCRLVPLRREYLGKGTRGAARKRKRAWVVLEMSMGKEV